MNINLRETKFFILNEVSKVERRKHMKKLMKKLEIKNFEIVASIPADRKLSSGAISHVSIVQKNFESNTFQPFVLLEDDCDVYSTADFPETISIPKNADVIYLGISRCSADQNRYCDAYNLSVKNHPGFIGLLRAYNMLSTHAILFLTARYASAYCQAMVDAAHMNEAWDTISTRMSTFFQVYIPKVPVFFQQGSIGGQEPQTKFSFDQNVADTVHCGQAIKYLCLSRSNEIYKLKDTLNKCNTNNLIDLLSMAKVNKDRSLKMYMGELPESLTCELIDPNLIYLKEKDSLFIASGTETFVWIDDIVTLERNDSSVSNEAEIAITNSILIAFIKQDPYFGPKVRYI